MVAGGVRAAFLLGLITPPFAHFAQPLVRRRTCGFLVRLGCRGDCPVNAVCPPAWRPCFWSCRETPRIGIPGPHGFCARPFPRSLCALRRTPCSSHGEPVGLRLLRILPTPVITAWGFCYLGFWGCFFFDSRHPHECEVPSFPSSLVGRVLEHLRRVMWTRTLSRTVWQVAFPLGL